MLSCFENYRKSLLTPSSTTPRMSRCCSNILTFQQQTQSRVWNRNNFWSRKIMNSFPDKFTPFAADCRLKVSKYNNCITFVPEHIISSENVENAQKVWCLLDMCRRDESVLFSFYRCCLLSGELWRTQGCFGLRGVVYKWHHFQGDGGWMAIYGSNDEDPQFKNSCQIKQLVIYLNNSNIFHSLQIIVFRH